MINLVFYANFTGGRTHVPALGGRGEPGGGCRDLEGYRRLRPLQVIFLPAANIPVPLWEVLPLSNPGPGRGPPEGRNRVQIQRSHC